MALRPLGVLGVVSYLDSWRSGRKIVQRIPSAIHMANSLAIFKRICHALPDAAQIHDLEADESEDELWQMVIGKRLEVVCTHNFERGCTKL